MLRNWSISIWFFLFTNWLNYINKVFLTIILIALTSISIINDGSNKYFFPFVFISIFLGVFNSGVRILRNSFFFDNVPNKK